MRFYSTLLIIFISLICSIHAKKFLRKGEGRRCEDRVNMDQLIPLLRAATFVAEKSQPPRPEGQSIFDGMGHIYDVLAEVKYFAQLAKKSNISNICETGFNAGHSAITFLWANPQAHYYGFDIGDMPWTAKSVELVNFMFPGRFTYIQGRSSDTLNPNSLPPGVKCDLFSVDGDHQKSYADFVAGKSVVSPHAYIIADDYSDANPNIVRDWKRAEDEGIIRTLDVNHNAFWMKKSGGYYKGWCLGQYVN